MTRELAVIKYVGKEMSKWIGTALAGLLGCYLLIDLISILISGGKINTAVTGIDITLFMILFVCIVASFRRNVLFLFQNSVSSSTRSSGLYLGHVMVGVLTVPLILFFGLVVEPLTRLLGVGVEGYLALPFIVNGSWNWKQFGIILLTGMIVAVVSLLFSLINYHLGGWKTFAFWAIVVVCLQFLLAGCLTVFGLLMGGSGEGAPPFVAQLIKFAQQLVRWVMQSYWNGFFLAVGSFLIISAIDLLVLRRLQIRCK